MTTCDLCGLPASPGEVPEHRSRRDATASPWHPRNVRAVHRFSLTRGGTWSCSRCGSGFPVDRSWAVDHQLGPDSPVLTFIVCPGCAADVRPVRLVVDTSRIEEVQEQPILDLVDEVRRRRGEHGERLRLRWADAHDLAENVGEPVGRLLANLQARGVAELS